MKKILYILLLAIIVGFLLLSFAGADSSDTEKCLDSVEKYMTPADAESFCKQPKDCRKWWGDMSDEEREELQPPEWKQNPDWWDKDKCYVMRDEI